MGSEGRGEQIIKTDRDNALILRDGFENPTWKTPARLLGSADRFGYPPCRGKSWSTTRWVQPLGQNSKINCTAGVYLPDADAQMNLAILSMPKPWPATRRCCRPRRDYLRSIMRGCRVLLRFARAVEQFDTPLGLFSQLLTKSARQRGHAGPEKGGIFPIVHGIRAPWRWSTNWKPATRWSASSCWWIRAIWIPTGPRHRRGAGFLAGNAPGTGLDMLANWARRRQPVRARPAVDAGRDLLRDALAVVKRFKTTIATTSDDRVLMLARCAAWARKRRPLWNAHLFDGHTG